MMVVWTREVAVGDEKWSDYRYILSDYFLLNVVLLFVFDSGSPLMRDLLRTLAHFFNCLFS